jgi:hypothetical protein
MEGAGKIVREVTALSGFAEPVIRTYGHHFRKSVMMHNKIVRCNILELPNGQKLIMFDLSGNKDRCPVDLFIEMAGFCKPRGD